MCVVVTLFVYNRNRKYVKRFGSNTNNNNSHHIEPDFESLDNFEQLIACHILIYQLLVFLASHLACVKCDYFFYQYFTHIVWCRSAIAAHFPVFIQFHVFINYS